MIHKKLTVVLVALLSIATAQAQTDNDRTTVYVDTVLGSFSIELFDDVSPNTVANFLNYVRDGDYDGTFFHRAIPGFILQGGGFSMGTNGVVSEVPSDPPVANEFRLSNIRGTIAMAKLGGDPNSATNQWFVNLADNSANLDAQNGGFTVFARVLGDGMDVVDAIAAQPIFNLGYLGVAFSDTPIIDYFGGAISREHLVTINSMTVIEYTLTSTGIASPASVPTGTSVLFTVTVTPGTNPASTGITVTADISSIGGSAAQTLFDDGTNGDVVSGDNVFSFLATVGSGTSSGVHSITVNVSDSDFPRRNHLPRSDSVDGSDVLHQRQGRSFTLFRRCVSNHCFRIRTGSKPTTGRQRRRDWPYSGSGKMAFSSPRPVCRLRQRSRRDVSLQKSTVP